MRGVLGALTPVAAAGSRARCSNSGSCWGRRAEGGELGLRGAARCGNPGSINGGWSGGGSRTALHGAAILVAAAGGVRRGAAPRRSRGAEASGDAGRRGHPAHQGTVPRPLGAAARPDGHPAPAVPAGGGAGSASVAAKRSTRPGAGVAGGPGETRILRAGRSCHPGLAHLFARKEHRPWGCAGRIGSCSAGRLSWAVVEHDAARLTSLPPACPWLGGAGTLVVPIAPAGSSPGRRTPHAVPFSAAGKVDFACDRDY